VRQEINGQKDQAEKSVSLVKPRALGKEGNR
jgi:hypothetical protein